jgi:small subunit ribosomal protein S8e
MRKSIESLGGNKFTGGRLNPSRMRRKSEIDRYPNEPVLAKENKIVSRRIRGGNYKLAIKNIDFINLNDKINKKTTKTKIIRVLENHANKDYERRGVLSKGAVVETELGIAKIVSRPGQHGSMNAILTKETSSNS